MKKNNLPEKWTVYFLEQPGRENPVIKYLNEIHVGWAGNQDRSYYGFNNDCNNHYGGCFHTTNIEVVKSYEGIAILTQDEFIELSKEVEPITELYPIW